MKRSIRILSLALALALLTGCAALDVILRDSPAALDGILGANPALVASPTDSEPYFTLSVDGETALLVSGDYAQNAEDLLIRTPLAPFVSAGLDPAALGAGYRADGAYLYLTADFGGGTGAKSGIIAALMESAAADRAALSYHAALDHYGIQLPAGKFEWAKDFTDNDKDLVFVLFAAPLAGLGVDVENIEGWMFMTMEDDAGMDLDVLVKPYSLAS